VRAYKRFVLCTALLFGCAPATPKVLAPSAPHPLIGLAVPDFQRAALNGENIATRGFVGRVVVVKFFARYCAPCVRTLPEAERVHQSHPGTVFLGIDEDDSEVTARELADKYRLSFPIVFDRDNVLSGRFRVTELPKVFVIDRSGIIRWVGSELSTEADLASAVDALQ
jgi:peroxiredoxin